MCASIFAWRQHRSCSDRRGGLYSRVRRRSHFVVRICERRGHGHDGIDHDGVASVVFDLTQIGRRTPTSSRDSRTTCGRAMTDGGPFRAISMSSFVTGRPSSGTCRPAVRCRACCFRQPPPSARPLPGMSAAPPGSARVHWLAHPVSGTRRGRGESRARVRRDSEPGADHRTAEHARVPEYGGDHAGSADAAGWRARPAAQRTGDGDHASQLDRSGRPGDDDAHLGVAVGPSDQSAGSRFRRRWLSFDENLPGFWNISAREAIRADGLPTPAARCIDADGLVCASLCSQGDGLDRSASVSPPMAVPAIAFADRNAVQCPVIRCRIVLFI